MSWRPAAGKDSPSILKFLLADETLCVPLTSRIRSGCRGCTLYFDSDEQGSVSDCLLYSSAGLLLPAFSSPPHHRRELAHLLSRLRPSVQSIMGITRCVEEAEALVPAVPTRRIEYFLMRLSREDARRLWAPPLPPGMSLRRPTAADAAAILPLQEAYEKEEVLLDPAHYSQALSLRSLVQSLREEVHVVLEREGRLVAKAATNARGFTVDQIGGVYTVPTDRGKGYAHAVMVALLGGIFAEKSTACLFVKKKNRPAISLYNGLGFQPVNEYTISYYGM
jgi:predicted GNAT family acetyltransferase